jgi:hypothetical protein
MDKDDENLFMYLLHICTSSFENCLLSSFAHLIIRLLIVWVLVFWALYYILLINFLSDTELAKIFLPFCRLSFQSSDCAETFLFAVSFVNPFSYLLNYWGSIQVVNAHGYMSQ